MKKLFYLLLAGVLTFSAVFMSGCAPTGEQEEAATPAVTPTATHNLVVTPSEENTTIKLFADASVSDANTFPSTWIIKTLTAVIEPTYATDQRVDWSFDWKDKNSEWASGKAIEDYIGMFIPEDGAQEATVLCKQGFGEPVIVNVVTRDSIYTEKPISASVQLDYAQKITGIGVDVLGKTISADATEYRITDPNYIKTSDITNTAYPIYSKDYTISDSYSYKFTVEYSSIIKTLTYFNFDGVDNYGNPNINEYLKMHDVGSFDSEMEMTNLDFNKTPVMFGGLSASFLFSYSIFCSA